MLWMIPAATAALGAFQGNEQAKRDEQWNRAQAEVTRYSPWTGITGQLKQSNAGFLNGALQGGMAGLGMAQGINALGGAASGATEAAKGASSLGGAGMAQELGQIGSGEVARSASILGAAQPATSVASGLGAHSAGQMMGGFQDFKPTIGRRVAMASPYTLMGQ